MGEIVKSVLMGLGCLSIMSFVGCSMMGAGVMVAADRAADAARAVAALRAGTPAATLGLKTSGRVDDGEEYYFAARIHLGPALFAIARRMRAGEVSEPIHAADGFHILAMVANAPPVPTPFAVARDQVLRDVQADKIARLQGANDRFLYKRADIKIAPDLR